MLRKKSFDAGPPGPQAAYAFGPFLLDPVRRLLWRDQRVVPLTSRAFDVLLLLLLNRDRVVDKDELLDEIWHAAVVEEGTLVRHVSFLRKAMGLRPEQHDCLVTVPGRGYRFVARVVELDELPPGLPTSVASEHGHIADDEILPALPDAPDAVISKDEPHEQIIGPVLARSISRWPSRSVWVAWAIVAAIATATTLGVGSARQRSDESSGRSLRQVTFGAGSQQEPTWSPDGRSLAYTSDRLGDFDIWVQPLSDAAPTRLTSSPERDWQPDWSPDGKWVAFRSERDGGGIYVVPSDGGEARRITTLGFRPRWSPDGTKIMFVSSVLPVSASPRVFVVGLDGQAPALVRPDLTRDLRLLDAGWHPDGRISFWGQHGAGGRVFSTASLIGTDEAKSRVAPEIEQLVKNAGIALERFAWSPKGRYLYFEGRSNGVRNLWRVSVEPETLTWTKGLDRLTTGAGSDTELALSRDGTKVAFTVLSERTRVWSFPFDAVAGTLTGAAGPVSADGVDEQGPAIGFDGKKLVYRASLGNRHEVREYSVPDGRERVLVGGKDGARTNMHWSPDGTRLAYDVRDSSTGARTRTTAILDSDGRERILQTPSDVTWATFGWSPEGQSLLGSCRQGGTGRLAVCLLPISSTPHDPAVRVITADPDRNLFQAQFSPNGQWVMFLAIPPSGGGVSSINVVSPSGGPWTSITDRESYEDKPRWAPDGRSVYFVSNRDGFLNVWGRRFDPVTGRPIGPTFRVTSFANSRNMLAPRSISAIEIAVAAHQLVLPLTESSGAVWVLDHIDK